MTDDQIRALLDDAVSDVEPRQGLDRIRARTAAPSRRPRRWAWAAGGAVVATAATVAVVAVLGTGPAGRHADPGFAGRSPTPTGQDGGRGSAEQPVPVYFLGDTNLGQRLFREFHRAPVGDHALDRAVEDALTGAADDADYTTGWPSGSTLQRAQLSDGVLSVDLSGPVTDRPEGMSAATARLALQQLVYTAQGVVRERTPVTFLVDGRPTATVLGVPTGRPVPNASSDEVLAQVWVTTPAEGAALSSPFTVDGVAAAFEATVQWELRQGGTVVERGFATARECCTMSPYRFTVTAPPGEYTLVVHDEDASGEHPHGLWEDTKRVTVR